MPKYNAILIGVLCALVGLGIGKGFAALEDWSTTAGSNNAASPDGFPENMAPSGLNNAAREVMAQVRRLAAQAVLSTFGIEGGSVNAYYITPSLAPAAAISGQMFHFRPGSTNTASATLKVGSIAAKTIVKLSNSTLASGDLQAGSLYTVVDDGTYYKLLNPQLGSLALLSSITADSIGANAVTLSKIATATAGNIITFNTSGNAVVVTPGIVGQVLTSAGPNAQPVMQTPITTTSITRGTAAFLTGLNAGGSVIQSHGLSGIPDYLDSAIIASSADCGYAPGDIVYLPTGNPSATSAETFQVIKTTTQLRIVNGTNGMRLVNWGTQASCVIANVWNLWVTPYKIN